MLLLLNLYVTVCEPRHDFFLGSLLEILDAVSFSLEGEVLVSEANWRNADSNSFTNGFCTEASFYRRKYLQCMHK